MAAKKKEVVSQQEVQEQIAPEIQSVLGGALKSAREAQQLTIKDVCGRLHLNEVQVTAMEQDDFSSFNDPTRARAFIRAYSRLLGLDEEQLISKHRQLFPAEVFNPINVSTETLSSSSESNAFPRYLLLFGALIFLSAFVWFLLNLNSTPALENAPDNHSSDIQSLNEDGQESLNAGAVREIQLPQPSVASDAAISTEAEKSENLKLIEADSMPKPVASMAIVKIVATENAWVEAKDSMDKSMLSKVLKLGSEEIVQGVPPIKLHIGNAKGTQIFYNGQPVDYSASVYSNTRVAVYTG